MRSVLAFNSTDAPVVVDDDGRQIGGRDWGSADPKHPLCAPLFGSGQLVEVPDLASERDANPQAVAAYRALGERRKRENGRGGRTEKNTPRERQTARAIEDAAADAAADDDTTATTKES